MSTEAALMAQPPVLEATGLRVGLYSGEPIIGPVDLQLGRGEILGLVGESGSGKTTMALAVLGYTEPGVEIWAGALELGGKLMPMDDSMRASRGSLISYVPQNPGRALNPALRIVDAIGDVVRAHEGSADARSTALAKLEAVGLQGSAEFSRRYPHQLSGGQQQRVCIAAALSCEPAVVVLDEPTTGLDVVTQARVLDELVRLRDEHGIAMVYVTHDLAVVANIADRIAVMYAGRIVEEGPAESLLSEPHHPYTRGLLASIPDHVRPRVLEPMGGAAVGVGEWPHGCAFAPRCALRVPACTESMPRLEVVDPERRVRCIRWQETPVLAPTPLPRRMNTEADAVSPLLEIKELSAEHSSRNGTTVVAREISFGINPGSCVALVGESGSGKTTIARVIVGLHQPSSGAVRLKGQQLSGVARHRTIEERRRIQLVAQNPADSLNPRHEVADAIARPARLLRGLTRSAAQNEARKLLERVRLPIRLAERYPAELSGGERQRVAIARALAAEPDLILCDEVTSALDVSVQAAVLALLNDLRDELGVGLLLITHDLGVVATVADDVLVLEQGVICERGPTEQVLTAPEHPYTRRLLDAAPSIESVA